MNLLYSIYIFKKERLLDNFLNLGLGMGWRENFFFFMVVF